ncbi:MAG: nucleoside kinase [Firmicutes bacterium]|nr:nucleoside kinase [Bacillota bacterium]
MERMIKVTFQDKIVKEFPANISLLEISYAFRDYFNYPVMIAKVDNNLTHLGKTITKKCNIDFYDRSSIVGNSVYSSSVQLMLVVAIKRVLGKDVDVMIEHSIDRGIYCELINRNITKEELSQIEKEMFNLVSEDLIFTKVSVARTDAIKYFKKEKQMDKVNVLKYISNSYVNLYRLDDVYDYFFGEMAYSTADIDDFKLNFINENGFVLAYPNIYNPECTLDYVHHKLVFDKFLDYTKWGKAIGIETAADLNEIVSTGKYNEIIRLAEAHYESQLAEISDIIHDSKKDVKIILIAGPSSSGKTTTSKKLAVYLQSKGYRTHSLSIDDYFLDRKDTPKKENGEYDFESLRALDLDLFNKHLTKLLAGEKVLLPHFNFVLGKREYKKYLQIKEKDLIIIEGLHALNDELTMAIEDRYKYKVYISPLTQLNIDNHNRIHTSDTRRLRRIIRDNKYRGTMASETLKMWKDIREGEEKYIFPYQDSADIVINTALVYELGVLKTYAEPLLFSVPEDAETYPEAIRLINFLRNFLPIPSDEVPRDSILREFIGGSGFNDI